MNVERTFCMAKLDFRPVAKWVQDAGFDVVPDFPKDDAPPPRFAQLHHRRSGVTVIVFEDDALKVTVSARRSSEPLGSPETLEPGADASRVGERVAALLASLDVPRKRR